MTRIDLCIYCKKIIYIEQINDKLHKLLSRVSKATTQQGTIICSSIASVSNQPWHFPEIVVKQPIYKVIIIQWNLWIADIYGF